LFLIYIFKLHFILIEKFRFLLQWKSIAIEENTLSIDYTCTRTLHRQVIKNMESNLLCIIRHTKTKILLGGKLFRVKSYLVQNICNFMSERDIHIIGQSWNYTFRTFQKLFVSNSKHRSVFKHNINILHFKPNHFFTLFYNSLFAPSTLTIRAA